jgi:hypothetical protein
MRAWLESVAGPEYASALMWTVFALIGLLVLLILIRIVRGLTFGTFVAGGRNRKARLAVMDATAVDSHRRLVLVRRDDVEHLILIGGPTDVVVEQNIRLVAPVKRPAAEESVEQPAAERPAAAVAAPVRQPVAAPPPPRPVQPTPPPAPRPAPEPRFSTMPPAAAPPVTTARPVLPPVSSPQAAYPVSPAVSPAPPAAVARPMTPPAPPRPVPPSEPSLDDALLQELEVSLERDQRRPAPLAGSAQTSRTVDQEMSRLLGDLSAKR